MGQKWLSRYVVLSQALLQCVLGEVTFTGSPGIIRTDGTQSVRLVWTLSQLTGSESGEISKDNVRILTYQWGTPSYVNGYDNSKVNFNMDAYSGRITVTINDISEDDAGQYACGHTPSGQGLTTNDDAVIYLYGKPMKPILSADSNDIVEGRNLELTCNSSSISLPAEYREPLEYIWFNKQQDITSSPPDRHHINGNRLTLKNVQRTDAAIYGYRCQAYEPDGLTSDKSTKLEFNVLYKPGAAQLQLVTQKPLIEKEDEMKLTCDIDEPGNPEPEYHWHNLDTGFNRTTQMSNNLAIPAAELTVDQHDGRWQCWGQNTAGQGEKSSPVNIIINAGPQVQEDLPSHRNASIKGTLSVTCSFKAKPLAQVTWKYNDSIDGLPPGVHSRHQDQLDGKYTVTSSTLSWSSSSTDSDKREAAGSYTCHASNSVGSAVSTRMILDVQYGPYDVRTEPESASFTYNETQQVSIKCRATCNPRCSFNWTRDKNDHWTSNGYQLNIRSVRRTHSDRYTCNASNTVGSKTLYVNISVNYHSEIKNFGYSASGTDILQGTEVTLACSVDSQPDSTINLLQSDKSLKLEQDALTLYYLFSSIHVTNSSKYQCAASNLLGPVPPASKDLELDVKGPFEMCNDPDPDIGKPLNVSLLLEICLTANPFPTITESDWSFVSDDSNTGSSSDLPEQVAINSIERDHKYKRIIQLEIKWILKIHYGTYSLRKKNEYGPSDDELFTFKLRPEGPPESPTGLKAVRVSTSSIHLSWRAEFSGGPKQTFWLKVIGSSGSIHTIKDTGHTDDNTAAGDLVEFTLLEEHGIRPSETYTIIVRAVNTIGNSTEGAMIEVTTPAVVNVIAIVIGCITALLIATAVVISMVVLRRKGIICQKDKEDGNTNTSQRLLAESNAVSPPKQKRAVRSHNNNSATEPPPVVARHGKAGPITGDIYTEVEKKPAGARDQPPAEPPRPKPAKRPKPQEGMAGPITGDVYAEVKKPLSAKPQPQREPPRFKPTKHPKPPANPPGDTAQLYAEVQKPRQEATSKSPNKKKGFKLPAFKAKSNPKDNAGNHPYVNVDVMPQNQQAGTHKEGPYANVMELGEQEGAYSEVQVRGYGPANPPGGETVYANCQAPDNNGIYANVDGIKPAKKFQRVGVDGTLYAELDLIQEAETKPTTQPPVIHGAENRTEYASIDYNKLKKKKQ